MIMEKKVIFIQVPDDITVNQDRELREALQKVELPYSFIVVPYFYKAMSADEIRGLLDGSRGIEEHNERAVELSRADHPDNPDAAGEGILAHRGF